jgi:hypothetical protein
MENTKLTVLKMLKAKGLLTEYTKKKIFGEKEGELIVDIPDEQSTEVKEYSRAIIETKDRSFHFISKYTFYRNGKVDTSLNQWREINEN